MTVEAVSSNSVLRIGFTPRASSWAINSCNRPDFKASESVKLLDSLGFIDIFTFWVYKKTGTVPQDRPDPPRRLRCPHGQHYR